MAQAKPAVRRLELQWLSIVLSITISLVWYYRECIDADHGHQQGQVTIPKPVRDRLGIKPGNAVNFQLPEDGRFVLVKVGAKRPRSRFEALRARAGKGLSTDKIMTLTRGEW